MRSKVCLVVWLWLMGTARAEIIAMAAGDMVDPSGGSVEVSIGTSGSNPFAQAMAPSRPTSMGGTSASGRRFTFSRGTLPATASMTHPSWVPVVYADDIAASFALALGSDTSTEFTIAVYLGYPYTQCRYALRNVGSNRYSVRVYHGQSETLLYESRERIGRRRCSTDYTLACSADAECPSNGTCLPAADGYWAEIETRQLTIPVGGQIQCQLWIWGRQQHPEEWFALGDAANVFGASHVYIGLPYGEAQVSVGVDDVVWARNHGQRIGAGHVGVLHPNANGTEGTSYRRNDCTGGSNEHWPCVWPWRNAGAPTSTGAPGLRGEYPRIGQVALDNPPTPLIGVPQAVQMWAMLLGGTGGSGTWNWEIAPETCAPGTGCTKGATLTGTLVASETKYPTRVDEMGPDGRWSLAQLERLEMFVRHLNRTGNAYFNVKALAAAYYVRRDELALGTNLLDHDVGQNDGQVSVALVGDSLAGATAAVTCTNDMSRTCNQDTYCSWDAPDGSSRYGDLPHGGCTSDAQCRTCVGRREAFNAGAGVQCTSNAQCPQTGGTCNTSEGVCNQNENIPCTENADCNGFGGVCDTTATCEDACPGGDCPVTAKAGSWASSLCTTLTVDNCFVCALGGERIYQMLSNRWDKVVTNPATDERCYYVGRGQLAQPDYVIVYEGANDLMDYATSSANCIGVGAVVQSPNWDGACRWNVCTCDASCTDAQKDVDCISDATCQSQVGPSSRCLGATIKNQTSTRGALCYADQSDASAMPACSMRNLVNRPCNSEYPCPDGMTCTDTEGDRYNGFCACTSHAQCGTGWRCVGGRCRRQCTVDAQCVESGRAGACVDPGDGVKVCQGRCTCPCDARTCATDADCDLGVVSQTPDARFPQRWHARGKCVSGRCTQCGVDWCGLDGPHPHAYQRTVDHLSPVRYARMLRFMHDDLAQRPDHTPPDGLPIVLVVEPPDWPLQGEACSVVQLYDDPGFIRQGIVLARRAGVRIIPGLREVFSTYYQTGRSSQLHTDWIHNTALGGSVIAQHIQRYLDRLNACRVTATDAAQRYCYSLSTRTYENTVCTQDADCTNPATVCRARKCASEADCPHAGDYCAAE